MMSKDRVHFKVKPCHAENEAFRSAFYHAFGQSCPKMRSEYYEGVLVVCRPSQFARFLIWRNEFGGRNSFKDLEAELVQPGYDDTVDVSRNPAKQC
jgi:hypothetical protein